MGLDGRHADARDQGRHRLRRLLHQRPHRGPARRGRGHQGPQGRRRTPGCSSCPGSVRVRLQAEDEGLDVVFKEAGAEWRGAGLLDVPGHEPRPARARRAQRVDVEPQLRGPAGQGRPHAPGLAAGRRRHRRHRHLAVARPTCPPPADRRARNRRRHGEVHQPHRHRPAAAPQQRRHRPDHPGRLPQAGHPHRLRGRAVRGLAQGPGVRPQPARVRRRHACSSPAPTSAPARRASTPCGR